MYLSGYAPASVGTSILVGRLTLDTTGMASGDYAVLVDTYDSVLSLMGGYESLEGSGTVHVLVGGPRPCCVPTGDCQQLTENDCLAQDGHVVPSCDYCELGPCCYPLSACAQDILWRCLAGAGVPSCDNCIGPVCCYFDGTCREPQGCGPPYGLWGFDCDCPSALCPGDCVACPGNCKGGLTIDLADFQQLPDFCMTGPGGWWGMGGPHGCACFDADADGDVDLADYAVFQAAFGTTCQ